LNLTLHFRSGSFLSYKPHYTRFSGEINHFVQRIASLSVHFTQAVYRFVNCKAHFLQFILHFSPCIAPLSFLQECPAKRKNAVRFASLQSRVSKRLAAPASRPAIFAPLSVIFAGRTCKKRRTLFKNVRRFVKIS